MSGLIEWFERVGRTRTINELRRMGYHGLADAMQKQHQEAE